MNCIVCGSSDTHLLKDFGPQPVCNRFPVMQADPEALFDMRLFQCRQCGMIQLGELISAEELRPRVPWITYNEPEAHLDDLAERIAALPGLNKDSVIWGVSFKDDSLLKRLSQKGFTRTYRFDQHTDLSIEGDGAGVETIQAKLTRQTAGALVAMHGVPDVIIARHIYEHALDPKKFIDFFAAAGKQGYTVLEVPDCELAIRACDYTTVWEEHSLYFTQATMRNALRSSGFIEQYFKVYPYKFENSMVAIVKADKVLSNPALPCPVEPEIVLGKQFASSFPDKQRDIKDYLSAFARTKGAIAMFGGGHLSAAFVNYLGIKDHISFVVDDNANKQGLFMPGSKLPIVPSTELAKKNIKLCLLGVSPEAEGKILARNEKFIAQGGMFASIFPASERALRTHGS